MISPTSRHPHLLPFLPSHHHKFPVSWRKEERMHELQKAMAEGKNAVSIQPHFFLSGPMGLPQESHPPRKAWCLPPRDWGIPLAEKVGLCVPTLPCDHRLYSEQGGLVRASELSEPSRQRSQKQEGSSTRGLVQCVVLKHTGHRCLINIYKYTCGIFFHNSL